ncbi:hypothetical protein PtA15_8A456 [Puccinia triticina]|uniref:Uncharacterized protein n=1 Tax=Puccinia triticina TaxID=208348 RepID=A0ABY7CXV4_9BASI|nr:uncharacterized protein PtA15_8A456 [Puccinia triticina]WAQ87552.1 hypothetical protein PtA15_8A456 [Puccinia triticina]WAR57401.1 hypothetical protein PtB15_8B448 [Puccinia triticina]
MRRNLFGGPHGDNELGSANPWTQATLGQARRDLALHPLDSFDGPSKNSYFDTPA